jgi:hypothetical protein
VNRRPSEAVKTPRAKGASGAAAGWWFVMRLRLGAPTIKRKYLSAMAPMPQQIVR